MSRDAVTVTVAARNNAAWCDVVCRAHGLDTFATDRVWGTAGPPPRLYPDAVTLAPDAAVPPGARVVKDSFATLDLEDFIVMFDAEWILRPSGTSLHQRPDSLSWSVVRTADEATAWIAAWGEEQVLLPACLVAPEVTALAGCDGDGLVAGAILNESDGVVGVTNLWANGGTDDPLQAAIDHVVRLMGDLPIVGYEWSYGIGTALSHGFGRIGPLRVLQRAGVP